MFEGSVNEKVFQPNYLENYMLAASAQKVSFILFILEIIRTHEYAKNEKFITCYI